MRGRCQWYGNESRTRFPSHDGRLQRIFRCPARFKQRYNTASANGTVLVIYRKSHRRRLLLTNVISKISKLILNLPKMIMNALVVTLSVVLKPM